MHNLTLSVHPDWPWIAALAFLLAWGYAALVVWLNNHRRLGRYFGQLSWLEVVVGTLAIAATVGTIAGLYAGLLVVAVAAVWGVPMIVLVVVTNGKRQAERDEQADAAR